MGVGGWEVKWVWVGGKWGGGGGEWVGGGACVCLCGCRREGVAIKGKGLIKPNSYYWSIRSTFPGTLSFQECCFR
jgi:hypothetical protein